MPRMNENNDTYLFITKRKLSLVSFICLRIKNNLNKKYTWEDCISNRSDLREFLIISSITRKIV